MQVNVEFRNDAQYEFFWSRNRNNCFSGGFGNGKSYIGCLRLFTMLTTFSNYRAVVARQFYKDLRATTMQTFFKICPSEFIESHNGQEGITKFINGSQILWMHLDAFDEQSLRGLEINAALIDQAEEIDESIFLILDSRIGRWDKSVVSDSMLETYPNWPRDEFRRPRVPTYIDILCNPDTTFHWIYRKYHPDSLERRTNYFYIEAATDERLNDKDTIEEMKSRDPEWVAKYIKGEWGASQSQIHNLNSKSLLDYSDELINLIYKHGALFRVLDHGETSPTCCLWVAAIFGVYIFYREYYVPNDVISNHRQAICDLTSSEEEIICNYADPAIFKKEGQRNGAFWTVADEYLTSDLAAPSIAWIAADNNEFATRNRINELLRSQSKFKHPVTGEANAPGIYFIKKCVAWPEGCFQSFVQLQNQRKVLIGSDNGKNVYSDDRDKNIVDHAYDCVRYFIAMHGAEPKKTRTRPPKNSFAFFNSLLKRRPEVYAGSSE